MLWLQTLVRNRVVANHTDDGKIFAAAGCSVLGGYLSWAGNWADGFRQAAVCIRYGKLEKQSATHLLGGLNPVCLPFNKGWWWVNLAVTWITFILPCSALQKESTFPKTRHWDCCYCQARVAQRNHLPWTPVNLTTSASGVLISSNSSCSCKDVHNRVVRPTPITASPLATQSCMATSGVRSATSESHRCVFV